MKRPSIWTIGLLAIPVSIFAEFAGLHLLVFVSSAVAILPLAGYIGRATEDLAIHVGPRLGGFLNATFGNVTELILAVFLILAGELHVVKLSITGAIIGNLLLVLGAAFLVGGFRYKEQRFNARVAGMHSASLALAVVGLMMPALFHSAARRAPFAVTETISIGVAAVLIVLYAFSVFFSFVTHQDLLGVAPAHEAARWSRRRATAVLIVATVFVGLESEFLVGSLGEATKTIGMSEAFVGLILIPVIGNAAEHASAVVLAAKDKVDVALEIAVGSSTQIALFIAPLLVFISLAVGEPMDFFFSGFEIAAVAVSVAIVALISLDGRSNWLEGAQLVAAYVIMGISFYYLPQVVA